LVEHVRELEKEMTDLKAWNADKKRYKLTDVGPGLTAYTLKKGMENGEVPHNLCASCYQNGKKSILQPETRFPGRCDVLACHRCGSALYLSGGPDPAHFKNRHRLP
jgi:hypothetical protein